MLSNPCGTSTYFIINEVKYNTKSLTLTLQMLPEIGFEHEYTTLIYSKSRLIIYHSIDVVNQI